MSRLKGLIVLASLTLEMRNKKTKNSGCRGSILQIKQGHSILCIFRVSLMQSAICKSCFEV